MTGRERVAIAMRGEKADRVPVFCQLSIGHYALHTDVSSFELWFNTERFVHALLVLAERYSFDGILVNLPGRPPDWEEHVVKKERKSGKTIIYFDNNQKSICPDNDNTHNVTAEEAKPIFDEVDPSSLFYIEPHDITGVNYPFSYGFSLEPGAHNRSFFPEYTLNALRYLLEKAGGRYHVSCEVHAPLSQLMELFGYSNTLMKLIEEPDKCEAMLDNLAHGTVEWALYQASVHPDAVLVSSPFAGGGFISREHYIRFVLPYEKYIVDEFHRHSDIPIYVHTCGAIGDRIDLMVDAGYDGIDTMDPPPLGNADIRQIKRNYGDRIFVKGNIDPVNVLLRGTKGEVYKNASQLISTVGGDGGYILSTACSVAPNAEETSIMMLNKASSDNPY